MLKLINILQEMIETREGVRIPALIFGTKGVNSKDMELILNNGFFALDMASVYNTDEVVFHTIKNFIINTKPKIERKMFYISYKIDATKVLPEEINHKTESLFTYITETFPESPPFIDMLVIHSPNHDVPINLTWAYMQQLRNLGKVKAIGVSNFNINHLKCMATLKLETPAINQVEINPFFAQHELTEYCAEHGITISAFRAMRNKAMSNDLNVLMDIGSELMLTPIQVIHSWKYTKGYQIVTISKKPEHMHELKTVVKLEEKYMNRLAALDKGINGRTCDGAWSSFDFDGTKWKENCSAKV